MATPNKPRYKADRKASLKPMHPLTRKILDQTPVHEDFLGEDGAYAALPVNLRRAVDAMVLGLPGHVVAEAAGHTQCAPATKAVHAHLIRRKPEVIAAVKEREALAMEEAGLTLLRSWIETRRIAYFDPADLFDEKGKLKPVTELSEDARAAIQSIEIETTYAPGKSGRMVRTDVAKIKLWNKMDALTLHLKGKGVLGHGPMEGALVINNNTQINNMQNVADRVSGADNPTDASIAYEELMRMTPALEHKP